MKSLSFVQLRTYLGREMFLRRSRSDKLRVDLATPEVPSSHGSLDAEGGADGAEVGQPDVDEATSGAGEDGLDSGESREWMRSRARQRKSEAERSRRGQRRAGRDPESEDDQSSSA